MRGDRGSKNDLSGGEERQGEIGGRRGIEEDLGREGEDAKSVAEDTLYLDFTYDVSATTYATCGHCATTSYRLHYALSIRERAHERL